MLGKSGILGAQYLTRGWLELHQIVTSSSLTARPSPPETRGDKLISSSPCFLFNSAVGSLQCNSDNFPTSPTKGLWHLVLINELQPCSLVFAHRPGYKEERQCRLVTAMPLQLQFGTCLSHLSQFVPSVPPSRMGEMGHEHMKQKIRNQ